jgi:hypothetical protein
VPSYAEWVSTAALGLSVLSIGWQVKKASDEVPRLVVTSHRGIRTRGPADVVKHTYRITVTNYGTAATTVSDVGWEREDEDGIYSIARVLNEPALREQLGDDVFGPPLPHRIDGRDQASWTVGERTMSVHQGRGVRGVAYTVGRPVPRWKSLRKKTASRVDGGTVSGNLIDVPTFGFTLGHYLGDEPPTHQATHDAPDDQPEARAEPDA